jgi:hypothetical protein
MHAERFVQRERPRNVQFRPDLSRALLIDIDNGDKFGPFGLGHQASAIVPHTQANDCESYWFHGYLL